jgi:hypothetical protein
MNINASSQSLINTLLQQASKSSEKKRPTFEEVFAKLNARSAGMDANKNPINNMLTNEQLFRYYIKETEPKLQMSNEAFSSDELFNPMKESDPTKTYGSASTLTSDIAHASNPANNLPNIGLDFPPDLRQPQETTERGQPRRGRNQSQYDPEIQKAIGMAESYIESGNVFLEYFNTVGISSLDENSKEFLNVIFSKNMLDSDWAELGQYMFDRIGNVDEVVGDLYEIMTAFSAMPDGLTKYYLPLIIHKMSSPNQNPTDEELKAILNGREIDLRQRFYKHKDAESSPGFIGLRNADGKYNQDARSAGFRELEKYRTEKYDPIDAISTFFIADNQAKLLKIKTGKDYETSQGDPKWVNPRLLEVQQRRRIGEVGGIINDLLDNMFNDDVTQLTTNTDINSTILDPQIVDNIAGRSNFFGTLFGGKPTPKPSSSSMSGATTIASPSSTIAEAGSGEVNIDDIISKRGRKPGTTFPEGYMTEKKLNEAISKMGAKGGGI